MSPSLPRCSGPAVGARYDLLAALPDLAPPPYPVELILPPLPQWAELPEGGLAALADAVLARGFHILSVHAPAARPASNAFADWGAQSLAFARAVSAASLTLHPGYTKAGRRHREQASVLENFAAMGGEDMFSIETFAGPHRLFTPEQILDLGVRLTLDTAHLHERDRVRSLIDRGVSQLTTVHLSAVGAEGQHLPVDAFCREVVERLCGLGWHGSFILEYLRPYHERLAEDVARVASWVASAAGSSD